MSASNVGDIEIVVNAANTEEAKAELASVEERLDGTADSMGESATEMEGLSRRMVGLGTALATGLAVVAGSLLSQLASVSQVLDGFRAIMTAVSFQMDQVLLPILTPLADGLFSVASAIFSTNGAMGDLIGIVGTIVSVLTVLAGIVASVGFAFGGLAGAKAAVVVAGKALIGVLGAVAGAISLPLLAVAALIAGLALLAFHFREEIVNAVTTAADVLTDWASGAADAAADFVTNLAGTIAERATAVLDAVDGIVMDVTDAITGLVDDAVAWGMRLIQNLVDGIVNAAAGVGDLFGDLASGDFAAVGQAVLDVTGGGGGAGGGGGNPRRDRTGVFGGTREQLAVFISGRQADQGVARYRDDNTLRRGRPQ